MWRAVRGWLAVFLSAVRVERGLACYTCPSFAQVFVVSVSKSPVIERWLLGRTRRRGVTAVGACASAVTALSRCIGDYGSTQARVPGIVVCRSGPNCL